MILPRRKFLMGIAGLLAAPAAPAIVRIESLMPVKSISSYSFAELEELLFKAENDILNRTIYIRLPNNWMVNCKTVLHING